jgi:hypothetical protein
VLLSGVHNVVITFSGGDFIRLTDPNPDEDFHKFGIGTTWAVKVVAGHFLRYWGYEGRPTVVITVHGKQLNLPRNSCFPRRRSY